MPPNHKAKLHPLTGTQPQVFRLRIELDGTTPLVWRRIEVLASATFWDLHMAIQNAFGWLDEHTHEFEVGPLTIGVPDAYGASDTVPGWTAPLSKHLGQARTVAYVYDFGDDWRHTIHREAVVDADGKPYPRCLAGENATPPENCGGVRGFEDLKEVLTRPKTAKYREMRDWLKNCHAKVYWPFDPLAFEHSKVVFRDPAQGLQEMLGQQS